MGVVVDERVEEIPGLRSFSFIDDPAFRAGREDLRRRKTRWIRSVILHTTLGRGPDGPRSQPVLVDDGRSGLALGTIRSWRSDNSTCSSSQLVIDGDGTVYAIADLLTECSFHARSVNEVSIGVEFAQDHKAFSVSRAQLAALLPLCDWLSARFGIQRQVQWPYLGDVRPRGPVKRLEVGGKDCVGFFGHRDQTARKPPGDPGDLFVETLIHAGYEAFNFDLNHDKTAWYMRQRNILGVDADGVPGPETRRALEKAGHEHGLWVKR